MLNSSDTCSLLRVIYILPANMDIYRYLLILSVIFTSGYIGLYIFRPIFVLRLVCNTSRHLIPTPSHVSRASKLMYLSNGTKVQVTVQYVYIVTGGSATKILYIMHLIMHRSQHITLALALIFHFLVW